MIDEGEISALLRAASDEIAVRPAPARELAAAGGKRRRRRWVGVGLATAAAVVAVAVAGPLAVSAGRSGRTLPSADPASTSCVDPVPSGLLPAWARTGFSDPHPRIPYVMGDSGSIVAILFAQPLTSPPSSDHNNKILWASRVSDGSPLRVTATLLDGSATATRVVDGGPGPSIIDLPEPGCWRFTLQWGENTDTLNLAYVAP